MTANNKIVVSNMNSALDLGASKVDETGHYERQTIISQDATGSIQRTSDSLVVINPSAPHLHVTDLALPPAPLLSQSNNEPTVSIDVDTFDHFKGFIKSKSCYNATPLNSVRPMDEKKCIAFQVDMWTLMEQRSVEWKTEAYRSESTPAEPLGNIFGWKEDNLSEPPKTNLAKEITRTGRLRKTQKKILCTSCQGEKGMRCHSCHGQNSARCSTCQGSGKLKCKTCLGTGILLQYASMKISWKTIHSVDTYQNTYLPMKRITKVTNKTIFREYDQEWLNSMFLLNYSTLFDDIARYSPVDFRKDIQQQYQDYHYAKVDPSTIIRRVKILIRSLDILQVDYQLEGFVSDSNRHKGLSKK